MDSARPYKRPGVLDETWIYARSADGSLEVTHHRESFDGATLSLYQRNFRNGADRIDSAYFYSRWYSGVFAADQDSAFNADSSLLVYQYGRREELIGGSRCDFPD